LSKPMKYWRKPLDQARAKRTLGQVHIIADRCKGCGFCIAYCPREVLRFSADFNKKGYHPPEVADASRCVNCHFCEVLCPEFAIFTTAMAEGGEGVSI